MVANFKLTTQQIEDAVEGRRFSEQVVEIARRLIVDGVSVQQLVEEHGVTRGRVYQIRDQIWNAHLQRNAYPPDWQSVTIMASPALISEFTERAERERERWLASKGAEAVK